MNETDDTKQEPQDTAQPQEPVAQEPAAQPEPAAPETKEPAPEPSQASEKKGSTESLADAITEKLTAMEKDKDDGKGEDFSEETFEKDLAAAETQQEKPAGTDVGQKPEDKKEPQPELPKTPEEEEAELIKAAKTERGQERLKQIFQERREGQQAKQSLGALVKAFADSGYDEESVKTVLDIGRLITAGDKDSIKSAVSMLDKIRSNLCTQIGEDLPPYDPVAEDPDLAAKVKDFTLDRSQAMEILNYRHQQAQAKAAQEQRIRAQQAEQEKVQRVNNAKLAVQQMLYTKRGEMDFTAKMKALQAHLTPANLRTFVNSVPPEMWAQQLEIMYNNIGAQPSRARVARPISSRQASIGRPASAAGATLEESIENKLRQMGI